MLSLARFAPRSTSRPALQFNACRRLSSSAPVRRSALITGAARGIGRAVALRLASDGFDICVSDLPSNAESIDSVVNEVRNLGREAFGALCDVTKMSQVEEAVQKSAEALGPLDVMVANAGIVQIQPLLDITPEELQKIYEVNVFGVVYSNVAAGKQFIKQGAGGKIINAASIAAYRGDPPGGLYCSTKAAVRSLTQGFAQEYGSHKITVNAYAPGVIETKMLEEIDVAIARMTGSQVGDASKSMEKTTVLRRNGNVDDVSRLVSFLAGPDSDFITGQTMIVDGGRVFS
ncbi:hypothetical protein AAF712_006388 [Marasmius tenuissimus]|uniref:Uncharacterized protein n=1 Tax=Marasmius tenuissimus TaxID=585030 RepID=A0ABR2ZY19_9AGAR|nr:hypothetical protein PM082_003489 [Marasmius tenuissimus]